MNILMILFPITEITTKSTNNLLIHAHFKLGIGVYLSTNEFRRYRVPNIHC